MTERSRKILIVEDNRLFARMLREKVQSSGLFSVVVCGTLDETRTQLEANAVGEFFLALCDLNLPDAPNGEAVDLLVQHKVPVIVFTGTFNEDVREDILAKAGVLDYVVKENPASLEYIVGVVNRVHRNRSIRAMVVDDSRSARAHFSFLLEQQMFQVLTASNGLQALQLLDTHPDIKLMLVDYNMPEMDGFQLIKKVREKHGKADMVLVGISAYGNNILSAQFIKNGANDFLTKPFLVEEFYCRVHQNMDALENIQALRESSLRDPMTGLHNRRYLFELGRQMLASARRGQITLVTAIVDIDFFKKVNDTHGHDAGDIVIKRVGVTLREYFRDTDVVVRMGGEEFCILAVNPVQDEIGPLFDQVRAMVENDLVQVGDKSLQVTISIGVNAESFDTLDETIKKADEMLYLAKEQGRNRVVVYTDEFPQGEVFGVKRDLQPAPWARQINDR
ncbi:MAG: diguanylate cyclase [Magnetococcales bacterium]|nr:diguanylate cyclase [Magnetococcales bacterium]MBF0438200.1 diguanylate cyclase [Magnetococcales bacterium]